MESGMYLELLSPTDCKLYRSKGELLQEVTLEGKIPSLIPGENEISFSCTGPCLLYTSFLMMLRLMLIAETEGENGTPEKLQLAFSTPRGWLEQGKQIRVSKAPTFFGEIDYRISSDIDNGNVHVTLSMPKQADSASQILLRLRTPGNKTIKKVTINGKGYKAFDVKSETIDLTGKTGLIRLSVRY